MSVLPNAQLRMRGWAFVIWRQKIIDEIKGYHPLNLPQQVGFWNQ